MRNNGRVPTKVQFNCNLPPTIARNVRSDARRNAKTIDDVASAILGDFFNAWSVDERSKFYAHAKPKKSGRKICLA